MLPEIIWICRFGLANLYEEKKNKKNCYLIFLKAISWHYFYIVL